MHAASQSSVKKRKSLGRGSIDGVKSSASRFGRAWDGAVPSGEHCSRVSAAYPRRSTVDMFGAGFYEMLARQISNIRGRIAPG
jgi:hypothetical protein